MNLPAPFYTIGWVTWILAFVALEALALLDRDRGDTLSEHVWAVIFVGGRPRPVIYYLVGGFLVWLVMHFLARGRFG